MLTVFWKKAPIISLFLSLVFVGCGTPTKISGNVSGAKRTFDVDPKDSANLNSETSKLTGTRTLNREVADSGTGLQVKSVDLLRNSIKSCVGDNLTSLKVEMFRCETLAANPLNVSPTEATAIAACKAQNEPPLVPQGRLSFLSYGKWKTGDDVITNVSGDLFDPARASRSGTGADGLSDSYLRALGVVADVVAHNCDVEGSCDCSSRSKAENLVRKCFPAFSSGSSQMKAAVDTLTNACATDVLLQRRKAIAAMLGSYAFASAR